MKRLALAAWLALVAAPPITIYAFQSPIASPAAPSSPISTSTPAATAASISPLIWIGIGLLLGAAIVFVVQRTLPHD